jgi:spore germination cell wall hydrolase CwlJ-like protein
MSDQTRVKVSAWRMPGATPARDSDIGPVPPVGPVRSRATLGAASLGWTVLAGLARPSAQTRAALAQAAADPEHHVHLVAVLGVALVLAAALTGPAKGRDAPPKAGSDLLRLSGGDLSEKGLRTFAAHLPPGAALIAARFAPAPRRIRDLAISDAGDSQDDAPAPPVFSAPTMPADAARALNAALPISTLPNPPAEPFVMRSGELLDQARALDCLTAAIYYEAGLEPIDGQRAVAQVVLNRLRHPAFPKTVCGVVFQGANRTTGCQFTFTCDGSLERHPVDALWRRSREVAAAALNGYVMAKVGTATHYHAVYVAPYWNTSLVKVANVGSQIFYRWTGAAGQPRAFGQTYAGAEPLVLPTNLSTPPAPTLDPLIGGLATNTASGPGPTAAPAPPTVVVAPVAPVIEAPKPEVVVLVDKPAPPPKAPPPPARRQDHDWSRLPVPSSW